MLWQPAKFLIKKCNKLSRSSPLLPPPLPPPRPLDWHKFIVYRVLNPQSNQGEQTVCDHLLWISSGRNNKSEKEIDLYLDCVCGWERALLQGPHKTTTKATATSHRVEGAPVHVRVWLCSIEATSRRGAFNLGLLLSQSLFVILGFIFSSRRTSNLWPSFIFRLSELFAGLSWRGWNKCSERDTSITEDNFCNYFYSCCAAEESYFSVRCRKRGAAAAHVHTSRSSRRSVFGLPVVVRNCHCLVISWA